MFQKLKLWYAHHQLKLAVQEEENLRAEAKRIREVVIPRLEREAKSAELDVLVAKFRGGKLQLKSPLSLCKC